MFIADQGRTRFLSMPQSARAPRDTFGLLADFFECRGDQALTQNEVAVCLEWLQQVTQPAIFSTPATIRKSARLAATSTTPMKQLTPHQPDMTPVKKQIKELLASATGTPARSDLSDRVMPIDGDVTLENARAPTSPATGPIIITRTAKTILDVLSSAGGDPSTRDHETPEKGKPVVALPGPSSQVAMAISEEGDNTQSLKIDDRTHHHPLIGDNAVTLYGPSHPIGEEITTEEEKTSTSSNHVKPVMAGSTGPSFTPAAPGMLPTMTSRSSNPSSEVGSLPPTDEPNWPTFPFNTDTTEGSVPASLRGSVLASQLPHFHFEI